MSRSSRLSVLVMAIALAACGSSNNGTTSGSSTSSSSGSTTTGSSSGSSSSGAGGSTSSSSSGSGGSEPGTTTLTASIGPIHVMPYQEDVQCIVANLKNAQGVFARRFKTTLLQGSHHMIVYRSNQPEDLTPKPCNSFEGILSGEHPVFIAQQAHSELDFPKDESGTDVGLELSPNQSLKIELHFINTGAQPIDVTGTADIDVLPLTASVVKSDLAFWGTTNIKIPAQGEFDTGVLFQQALAGTSVFALTTHQHHLGTEMKVWFANDAQDQSMMVADGKSWSDPPLEVFNPPLKFPANGTKGFSFDCHWKNTTANTVKFGEGFNDEMCFLWHYYFPSKGFQICYEGKGCLASP